MTEPNFARFVIQNAMESAHQIHGLDLGSGPPSGEVMLWTNDVDEAFASITARGARPLSEPHHFLADLRDAWVAESDRNPVQMVMTATTPLVGFSCPSKAREQTITPLPDRLGR